MKIRFLIAAMIVLLVLPPSAHGAGRFVLLVYRLESELKPIANVLSACGYDVKAVTEENYSAESLVGCSALVSLALRPCWDALAAGIPVVCIGPQAMPAVEFQMETSKALGGVLHIGPLYSSFQLNQNSILVTQHTGVAVGEMVFPLRGSFPYGVLYDSAAYVPNFSADDIQPLAMGYIIRQLLHDEAPGRLFLLFDEVYPFSDLGMLCHMADALYARGYPFTVSAMPVYENLNYPAYLRYAQVLRYIQFRGGAVVMHDPIIRMPERESESIGQRLALARAAFEQQGIVLANGIVSPYPLSLNAFVNLSSSCVPFGPLPMDLSVTLPIARSPEEFDKTLELISNKWVTVASLQKMVTGTPFIYNEQPVDEAFVYREEVETSFNRFFSAGNQTLLVILLISLIVFSGLLTGGYFLYRRKFFR